MTKTERRAREAVRRRERCWAPPASRPDLQPIRYREMPALSTVVGLLEDGWRPVTRQEHALEVEAWRERQRTDPDLPPAA